MAKEVLRLLRPGKPANQSFFGYAVQMRRRAKEEKQKQLEEERRAKRDGGGGDDDSARVSAKLPKNGKSLFPDCNDLSTRLRTCFAIGFIGAGCSISPLQSAQTAEFMAGCD
eukprot:3939962-Rhodomonas_salina.2